MATTREVRLREVQNLSRKPHAELHAKLLEAVFGATDQLAPEDWLLIARKSPDRLIQALAMSGRLAGYSERNEVTVSGNLDDLSDAEIEARLIAYAESALARLAAVPAFAGAIATLTPAARGDAIEAITGGTYRGAHNAKFGRPNG